MIFLTVKLFHNFIINYITVKATTLISSPTNKDIITAMTKLQKSKSKILAFNAKLDYSQSEPFLELCQELQSLCSQIISLQIEYPTLEKNSSIAGLG